MSVADRMAILREGRLQQVGPPVEIYDDPATDYVAGILGAPEVNLMPLAKDGRASRSGVIALPSPAPVGAVTLGVRPEDARLDPDGAGPRARIAEVEPLGGFTVVSLDVPGELDLRLLLRGQPDCRTGEEVAVRLSGTPFFFDADGRRVRA